MKVALFSDLHCHTWGEFDHDGDRLRDCASVIPEIRDVCLEEGITTVMFGGDMYQKRSPGPPTRAVVAVTSELVKLRDSGLTLLGLHGNHDQANRTGTINAMQPLVENGLVDGPFSPGAFTFRLRPSIGVAMLPYCQDPDTFWRHEQRAWEALEKLKTKKCVLLAHHGFTGAKVGSVLEYVVPEAIDASRLKRWFAVFSGHYHKHQALQGHKHGWYIGAPLQHRRGDPEHTGFLIWDSITNTIERRYLKRPVFMTVDDEWYKTETALMPNLCTGHFVDLVCEDAGLLAEATQDLQQYARGVKPLLQKKRTSARKERTAIAPTFSSSRVLKSYLKYRRADIRNQGLDRKRLLALGQRILRGVQDE